MKTLILFLTFAAVGAYAQDFRVPDTSTGNAFLSSCSVVEKVGPTHDDFVSAVYCLGYIHGLMDGLRASPWAGVCMPTDAEAGKYKVTTGQLVSILLKYVRDNPETAHYQTATLFVRALERAFPCK